MLKSIYLSLGSNIGDRTANLREAIERLGELGTVTVVSSFYETEPVEFTQQPWFLNCAVEMKTEKGPSEFLAGMLAIEQQMGRQRTQPKGPRKIDLDILLFADEVVNTPELTIPHPTMHERSFVLEPLAEIAPDVQHPVLRQRVAELRSALPKGGPEVRKAATPSPARDSGNQRTP